MTKTFVNQSLITTHKRLIAENPNITPTKGSIGGFSIEFTTGTDTTTYESIIYKDDETRNADLELLIELLQKS